MQSSLPLLQQNGLFLSIQDLGRLACTSRTLCQFITDVESSSDEDVWSHVLCSMCPSAELIPRDFLLGDNVSVSRRMLCERLVRSTARPVASNICTQDNSSLLMRNQREGRRMEFRRELLRATMTSESSCEEPGLPEQLLGDPVLKPSDVMILMDIYQHDTAILSMAIRGDAGNSSLFSDTSFLKIEQVDVDVARCKPIELDLTTYGELVLDVRTITVNIYFMRLSDFQMVCVHKTSSRFCFSRDSSFWNIDLDVESGDIIPLGGIFVGGNTVGGTDPTLLTSRIVRNKCSGSGGLFRGFCFDLTGLTFDPPWSPYHYGYKYTVSKYRDYVRSNGSRAAMKFGQFRCQMWENAVTNSDLFKFFDLAKRAGLSSNGKYLGRILPSQKSFCLHAFVMLGSSRVKYGDNAAAGVTLLHVLDDLFDGIAYEYM